MPSFAIRKFLLVGAFVWPAVAFPFQLAPLGSQFEAKLTNETPSWLGSVAGQLGLLLKSPVHEEITQLAHGCPQDLPLLSTNVDCAGADRGFASPYVIYGVRWNDLPPFRLTDKEGAQCKRLRIAGNACNPSQTIRFSTQPECWLCLFNDAEQTAQKKKITGCAKGEPFARGNLMTRSHFGDLQFLHGMASENDVGPEVTREKVLGWLEFAWKVSSREIKPDVPLKSLDIDVMQEHFGCSEWTAADIYILGRTQHLLPRITQIAFGSVLHTVQDSFAAGHVSREETAEAVQCPGTLWPRPPRVLQFHSYGDQDGKKHDAGDNRVALVSAAADQWPLAVEATRNLLEFREAAASWAAVKPYVECLFDLGATAKASAAGDQFRRDR